MADDCVWIATDAALASLCARLETSGWLAVDTEFMRERTYYPQLCLVQVATADRVACVDVLAIQSLEPLFALLQNPRIIKVLHSARQDLEMFFHLSARVPAPIFDTQIAASFAGFPDQAGYASVVQGLLGITLEKTHTRADWSRRPLPEAVVRYAADDVRYLRDIYLRLRSELEANGRLPWLESANTALTDPAVYRPDPDTAWQRLRGLQRLKPRQFAAAKALAAWRERQAMTKNLPRQWVLKDEVLTDMARQLPADPDALQAIRGMQESLLRKHGEEWLALILHAGSDVKPEALPERLAARDEALVDVLMALVRIQSTAANVSAAQLTTRGELEQLVRGRRDLAVLQGWRMETAGKALLDLLDGKTTLAVHNGVLEMRSVNPN